MQSPDEKPLRISDISMKDVARLSGVSKMTVSRALRAPDTVSPKTLTRIQAVIESTGYVPNRVAGNLSLNRTTAVAIIVPSLSNALYAETLQGISDLLEPHGFQLMISDGGYSLEKEEKLIKMYVAERVCGIILHNTSHTEKARKILLNSGIPCVETGNLRADPIDMCVSYSNFEAGQAMAAHLISLRYRKFGFASLPVSWSDRLSERRRGFVMGLKRAGLSMDPRLILEVEPGLESGARALGRMLDLELPLDAVFFAGDVLAAGAVIEAQRRAIKIPGQLAIAASDDNDLMQTIIPSLSTVRFPRYQIGSRAAELIVNRSMGVDSKTRCFDLGFEIIQRNST
jgi:LacI family gluconate utilization system Gnt-I transcriptional repressor